MVTDFVLTDSLLYCFYDNCSVWLFGGLMVHYTCMCVCVWGGGGSGVIVHNFNEDIWVYS